MQRGCCCHKIVSDSNFRSGPICAKNNNITAIFAINGTTLPALNSTLYLVEGAIEAGFSNPGKKGPKTGLYLVLRNLLLL